MPPEPLVLAFDTSAAHCAAALLMGDRVLARAFEAMAMGQAERLTPMLEEVLAQAGKVWKDLDAVACGTGPGNFTGIRIAVATARGLALALDIPAIGVTLPEALAFGSEGEVLVSLDGKLGRVIVQRFHNGTAMDEARLCAPEGVSGPPALCKGFDNKNIAARTGGGTGSGSTVPDPAAIARIALGRLGRTVAPPVPFYLRPADALPSSRPAPVLLP